MANYNETGNAKNVANFTLLVLAIYQLGDQYRPSNPIIFLDYLNSRKNDLNDKLILVRNAENSYKAAVNERQLAFEQMKKLTTRILGAFESSTTNQKYIQDVKSLAKKVTGVRITAIKTDEEGNPNKTISTAQLSFDSRLQNFKDFFSFVTAQSAYRPNEPELQTNIINTYINNLEALTQTLNTTQLLLRTARIERDKALYDENTGAIVLTQLIKKYVKSVLGTDSPVYKNILKIAIKGNSKLI